MTDLQALSDAASDGPWSVGPEGFGIVPAGDPASTRLSADSRYIVALVNAHRETLAASPSPDTDVHADQAPCVADRRGTSMTADLRREEIARTKEDRMSATTAEGTWVTPCPDPSLHEPNVPPAVRAIGDPRDESERAFDDDYYPAPSRQGGTPMTAIALVDAVHGVRRYRDDDPVISQEPRTPGEGQPIDSGGWWTPYR